MTNNQNVIITRLTALWALNECGLGGFMHALSSPFTGIVVGGISVLLISLIALNSTQKSASLIKALCIVLIVKLGVSPHSPVTAYFAVSFQAFMGLAIYSLFSINQITILSLSILSFFESAIQKLLTLTIIYGESLWMAIDTYLDWITSKFNIASFKISSGLLASIYILFYILSGFVVGIIILKTIKLMNTIDEKKLDFNSIYNSNNNEVRNKSKRLNRYVVFWLTSIVIILLPLIFFSGNYFGWKSGLYLIARSLLIIGLWYIVLAPIILKKINTVLGKKEIKYQSEINEILNLLPSLKSIIRYAWQESKSLKGINRMQNFLAKSIVYSLHFNPSK